MYTIGQMSQLCHISARRLRYFEAMGILKPAMLSEKGYRYYQAEQLSEIMTIAHLQHYGLTLTEIGQFLSGDETLKVQILRRQRAKNEQTLNTLQQSLADLTRDIEELEGTMTNNEQEAVITMLDPAGAAPPVYGDHGGDRHSPGRRSDVKRPDPRAEESGADHLRQWTPNSDGFKDREDGKGVQDHRSVCGGAFRGRL